MTPEELERFGIFIEELDRTVADRPDLLASPVAFVVTAVVGAARSDPADAWSQVAGMADILQHLTAFVREGRSSPDVILAALFPMPDSVTVSSGS